MGKIKVLKTYSHARNQQRKAGQLQKLSDLFDIIVEAPLVRPFCSSGQTEIIAPLKEHERNHSSFEKGPTAATVKNKLSPRIALFVDDNDCDDGLQSSDYTFGENVKTGQKPVKRSVKSKHDKGYSSVKRLVKKGVGKALKHAQESEPSEESNSTTMNTKFNTEQLDIEMWREDPFAERKKLGVMWNSVEKREDAEHKFSISMSDTVANSSSSPSIHSQPAFSFNQQWKAADLKKRSFIKIRTPGYLKRTCDGQELSLPSYSQETSSYTSIYTWTTATNSAPKTGEENTEQDNLQEPNMASVTSVQKPCINNHLHSTAIQLNFDRCCQQTPHLSPIGSAKGEENTEQDNLQEPNMASVTSVQKPCINNHLHSTAIQLNFDRCCQQTPHLSPIGSAKGYKMKMATPSGSKLQAIPRCPRKVRVSASGSSHKAAPKCSTMLFGSSFSDTDDIALNLSPITKTMPNARCEADIQETVKMNESALKTVDEAENYGERILTSTPLAGISKRNFVLNLSSLHSPSDCDIIPLRESGDIIHSDEIVAESIEDSCTRMSKIKIQREGNKVGSGDSKDTSGIRKVAPERTVNEDVQIISSNKGGSSTEVRDVKTDYQMNEKHQDTVMEICPVSTMGMVENSWNKQTRSGSKAGILLWIEPADSGFIDMLQTAPPDDISLLSYKSMHPVKQ
ncbi:uncharacterized protein LOC112562898 isoform X2 [Pomacea canaliculata]|uniref:uncharacterized protein LOC112562898 isoform X2 n=1 Tax=Pomacea canaliculata TaxID=400727 RepID=UPI000D73F442|nr:uncharacterized protein LOC112562898 isoform X2 [Pomacea canaliculata]